VVIVGGVPMSAWVAEPEHPEDSKAVIVAIHGGGTTAMYFDCPGHPSLSLLRTGAARGFTVVALDRPGMAAPLRIRRRPPDPNSGSSSLTGWWIASSGNNRAAPDRS